MQGFAPASESVPALQLYSTWHSNVADHTWLHGGSDGEILAVIRDGIGPDFAMDSFDGPLSAEEI